MKTTRRHYVGYLTTKHHHLVVLLCRSLQVGVAGEQLRLGRWRHGGEMSRPRAVNELPQISDAILMMVTMMVLHFHRRRLTKKKKRMREREMKRKGEGGG